MFVLTYFTMIFFVFDTQIMSDVNNDHDQCALLDRICNPNLERACCTTDNNCKLVLDFHYICVKKSGLGKLCLSGNDCNSILHAKCSELNKCVCRPKNLKINDTCIPLLKGFCWKDEKCATTNAVCIDSECRCKDGFIQHIDQCISHLTTHVGMPCSNSDTCEAISKHTTCSNNNNRCECEPNYILTESSCAPQLDMECKNDDVCADINSECIKNVCQCKHYYGSVSGTCVQKPDLYERCIDHSDCNEKKFTICGISKRCICRPNYIAKAEICMPGLGAYCQRTEQCAVEYSGCIDNKCQCTVPATSTNEQCPKPDSLGKQCESNVDCKSIINSVCSMKKCVCIENFAAFSESACSPTLNETCLNDDQCLIRNFSCIDNKCQCRPYYIPVSVSQCLHETELYSCYDSLECSDLWHSRCSENKKCVCQPDNISIGRSCLPQLDGYCWRHDQCLVLNSECFDYRCACKSNFIKVANNRCVR